MDKQIDVTVYKKALDDGLLVWNLVLSDDAKQKICLYLHMLSEKNKVMNLTAVTEPLAMVKRHVLDSLALIKYGLIESGTLIDIGSGAGLPGIVLAIANPNLSVTLLDSTKKRISFLEEVATALGLENIECLWGRAEEFSRDERRESYDYVTARAVASLDVLAEYSLPYLKIGGKFLPHKSDNMEDELQKAKRAIDIMGGKMTDNIVYSVPDTDIERLVLVIEKVTKTPPKYPRKTNEIGKKNI